jgi:endonuclease-3
MDALVDLPGVGRKTANVVLGTAFGIAAGVVVDTHVQRVSGRLGLTREKNADKIERDLMEVLPEDEWVGFSHMLILHGRRTCAARSPRCPVCALQDLCPSAKKFIRSGKAEGGDNASTGRPKKAGGRKGRTKSGK